MSLLDFHWVTTPRPDDKDEHLDLPLTASELVGLKDVYREETEGKRQGGGGGKNDNAGKSKDKRLVWQRRRPKD